MELMAQKRVPARYGRGVIVKAGQRVKVSNPQGSQVGDLFAFVLDSPGEFLSPTETLERLGNIYPQLGEPLYSNLQNPLLVLEEDTVKVHDMLFQACDPPAYRYHGLEGHRNCRENLNEVLEEYQIVPTEPPRPINLFQNTPIVDLDGRYEARRSPAGPGDYVLMEALQDLLVVVSACPWEMSSLNGESPSDLTLEVYE